MSPDGEGVVRSRHSDSVCIEDDIGALTLQALKGYLIVFCQGTNSEQKNQGEKKSSKMLHH